MRQECIPLMGGVLDRITALEELNLGNIKIRKIQSNTITANIAAGSTYAIANVPSDIKNPITAAMNGSGFNLVFVTFYAGKIYAVNPSNATQSINNAKFDIIIFYT